MFVFLALDLIVPLLVYFDEKRSFRFSLLNTYHILYWLAALFLILLAGLRANTVGTDTGGYLLDSFNEAHRVPFFYFYSYSRFMAWDPLFKIVMYFTSSPFSTLFVCQTVCSALTVIPIFISIRVYSSSNRWLAALVFTSLLYPMSFNLIRQSIAMAFITLAFVLANKRNYLFAIICTLFAIGFHKSALIGLFAFLLLLTKPITPKSYLKVIIPIFILVLLVVVFAKPILTWITSSLGIYGAYIVGEAGGAPGGRRSLVEICLFASSLALILIKKGSARDIIRDPSGRNLATLCIIGILLYALCTLSIFLYRIGLYYLYFFILFAPYCASLDSQCMSHSLKLGLHSISYTTLIIVLFCFAISIDYYGICLMNEVVPYAII